MPGFDGNLFRFIARRDSIPRKTGKMNKCKLIQQNAGVCFCITADHRTANV